MSCTRSWEVRAIDEGRVSGPEAAAFERHVRGCAACREELSSLQRLRDLARELPLPEPAPLDLRRLRGRILRDAATQPAEQRPPVAVGLAAALALLGVVFSFLWWHAPRAQAFAATVSASPGASWTQARVERVERVVLVDGDLTIHVRKQQQGERFLVVLPDGEIEVRGTTFEVSVHGTRTTSVHVDEGVVVLRANGVSTLSSGDAWEPASPAIPLPGVQQPAHQGVTPPHPETSAVVPSHETQGVSPSVHIGGDTSPSAAPSPESVTASERLASVRASSRTLATDAPSRGGGERPVTAGVSSDQVGELELADYDRAVAAYHAGQFEKAADLFHSFAVAHTSSSFLDDASFLEASSLAGAGRIDAAALVAERHLAQFPSSFHRRDASILVARLRRNRGDCEGARRALGPWIHDSPRDARVAAALGECAPP